MSAKRLSLSEVATEIHSALHSLSRSILAEKEAQQNRVAAQEAFNRQILDFLHEREKLIEENQRLRERFSDTESLARRAHGLATANDISGTAGVEWDSLIPEHKAAWRDFVHALIAETAEVRR